MKVNRMLFSAIFAAGVLAASAFAQDTTSDSQGDGGTAWRQLTVTGTVQNVDKDSNTVTIEDSEGYTRTFAVDQSVNLDSINNGDQVSVTFYQSIAAEVRAPTEQERQNPLQVQEGVASAPPGTDPAAGGLAQIKAVVTVQNVDMSSQTVTVQGPEGNTYMIYVPDSNSLQGLSEGDTVVITYTEALAVEISKQ